MEKIALDLDGVVFDSENLFRVYSEIYDVDINKKDTILDNSERTFQKRYNWTKEESQIFYNKHALKILRNANIMTGADIVLNKLKDRYKLIVVTARNELETEIAKTKLKKIGLNDIQIFNDEHDKIDRLMNENADYMIDDDIYICINAANKNIQALYFKNNAQEKIEKENLTTVNNWGEVYKKLVLKRK